MNRFDVYLKDDQETQKVVILQSDLHLRQLDTIIVAPLVPDKVVKKPYLRRLLVPVTFESETYFIIIPQAGPILKTKVTVYRGSLSAYHHDIIEALDFLFQGF